MIVVDMPMPKNCEDCPMSYWIRSGDYEGLMMCNALEFRESMKLREPAEDITKNYLVDSSSDKQPERCPIVREGNNRMNKPKCGDCKWLDLEQKTTVGYRCVNPNIEHVRMGYIKQKSCPACKRGFKPKTQ